MLIKLLRIKLNLGFEFSNRIPVFLIESDLEAVERSKSCDTISLVISGWGRFLFKWYITENFSFKFLKLRYCARIKEFYSINSLSFFRDFDHFFFLFEALDPMQIGYHTPPHELFLLETTISCGHFVLTTTLSSIPTLSKILSNSLD